MIKTHLKFQKNRANCKRGFCAHKVHVPTTNSEPRTTKYAPWKAENYVPSVFFEKAGDKNEVAEVALPRIFGQRKKDALVTFSSLFLCFIVQK